MSPRGSRVHDRLRESRWGIVTDRSWPPAVRDSAPEPPFAKPNGEFCAPPVSVTERQIRSSQWDSSRPEPVGQAAEFAAAKRRLVYRGLTPGYCVIALRVDRSVDELSQALVLRERVQSGETPVGPNTEIPLGARGRCVRLAQPMSRSSRKAADSLKARSWISRVQTYCASWPTGLSRYGIRRAVAHPDCSRCRRVSSSHATAAMPLY